MDLDVHRHPVAVVGEARRRHHAVVGDRESAHRRAAAARPASTIARYSARIASAIACEQLLVGLVVFVPAVGDHARRRGDRQEPSPRASLPESRLEIFDVAPQLRLPGVRDRPDAHRHPALAPTAAGGPRRVELAVELGEAGAIGAAVEAVRPAGAPALEPGQALQGVLRPADRLAELAVARPRRCRLRPGAGPRPRRLARRHLA